MTRFDDLKVEMASKRERWLVTGAAGFIGSHLVHALLELDQEVVAVDDLSTGHRKNLPEHARLTFIEGDVADLKVCTDACDGVQRVLHQAALGSVPRSIERPLDTHRANVDGFINMLSAAKDAEVERFVYASSSSVYGDAPELPKVEHKTGAVLSPYAATKAINEVYAEVFQKSYGLEVIGLRYFNVFGPRQDPDGPYAAVMPRWIATLLAGDACEIYGDGETSRDFCYVDNAVQANLLAATAASDATGAAYNVAYGERTTLNELYAAIREALGEERPAIAKREAVYKDFRAGDVRHSLADISAARTKLGYAPGYDVQSGLNKALAWYVEALG